MAIIVKCNVCGKEIDISGINENANDSYIPIHLPYITNDKNDKYYGAGLWLDMCPKCFEKFIETFNNGCAVPCIVDEFTEDDNEIENMDIDNCSF